MRSKLFVKISLKYKQKDATFSRSIYFYKLPYMFQAVSPPIIRSTKLYIQRQVLSKQYCCLLLSWMRWNAVPSHPHILAMHGHTNVKFIRKNENKINNAIERNGSRIKQFRNPERSDVHEAQVNP